MNRLKTITKYFVKDALQEMFASSKMGTGLIITCMILIVVFLSFPFAIIVGSAYEPLYSIGQEGLLLTMILFSGATVTFFFGIYTVMNVFYFSNDIECMLPLPFKSSELVFGKFIAVLIYMYIYSGILVLPLIVYGVASGAGVIYYIYALVALIITPVLPMIIASIVSMVLMRFTGLSKHKDAFRMFGGCLSLILVVVFNLFTQTQGRNMDSASMLEIFSKGNNSMMDMVTSIFITNKFAALSLLYNSDIKGLLYIIITLALSIGIFVVYYLIGGKIYLKGIIGISEAYSSRENILEKGNTSKLVKSSSPIKALVSRDIKVILRTPQFFINCIAMLLYMPAIFGVLMMTGGQLEMLKKFLNDGTNYYSVALVIAFAGSAMCTSGSGTAITALSREGKDFMISKYIPVSFKDQLHSKIISSLCINIFGAVIMVIGLFIVKASPIIIALGAIAAIGGVVLITILGILIDFNSPKLTWEDERAMFKGNFMPMIISLGILLIGGILAGLATLIKNYFIIFLVITIMAIGITLFAYKKLVILADRVYNEN